MQQETEQPINSEWADSLEYGVPETVIASAQSGRISPELTNLHVRMSAQRLPDGEAVHFHAHLGDFLIRVYEKAADALHEQLLPPPQPRRSTRSSFARATANGVLQLRTQKRRFGRLSPRA
jgi:hypothetical protein